MHSSRTVRKSLNFTSSFSVSLISVSGRCCLDGSSIHQPILCCLSHSPDTSTHPILRVLLTDLYGLPLFLWLPGSWVLLIRQNDSERRPEIREIEEFSISYLPWGKLRRSFWLVIWHGRIGLLLIILSTSPWFRGGSIIAPTHHPPVWTGHRVSDKEDWLPWGLGKSRLSDHHKSRAWSGMSLWECLPSVQVDLI